MNKIPPGVPTYPASAFPPECIPKAPEPKTDAVDIGEVWTLNGVHIAEVEIIVSRADGTQDRYTVLTD